MPLAGAGRVAHAAVRPNGAGTRRQERPVEPRATDGARTLVWMDGEEAIIVRWTDRAEVERVCAIPRASGTPDGDVQGRNRPEGRRHFVASIADRIPPEGDVAVVGPGDLRGRLERLLRADDRRHGRRRAVRSPATRQLTENQLLAHVRALAGGEDVRPSRT
jgi:hypothetical protein